MKQSRSAILWLAVGCFLLLQPVAYSREKRLATMLQGGIMQLISSNGPTSVTGTTGGAMNVNIAGSTGGSNGVTSFGHISAYPESNAVTTTPTLWVTDSGTSLANKVGVVCGNPGSADVYLLSSSSTSPLYYWWYIPAGTAGVYVPFTGSLYTYTAASGGSTLICTEVSIQ